MVTTLYLIRHGETEGAEVRRYKGSIDVPLSDNGANQMKRVTTFVCSMIDGRHAKTEKTFTDSPSRTDLAGKPIHRFTNSYLSAVYCSDLSRAIKSAEIIGKPFGLKPVVMPGLRERNFGIWEGMSFDEIREKYPEEFAAWAKDPLRHGPINGESTIEVADRGVKTLNRILNNHNLQRSVLSADYFPSRGENKGEGENIAIVAHGGINRVILCHLLGIPLENIFRIEQDYGCVNIIEFWDKYPVVKLINGRGWE